MPRFTRLLFVIFFLVICPLTLLAQTPAAPISYQIPFSSRAPAIDGEFSGTEWEEAEQVTLDLETDPTENIPAIVSTTVYLMEDGEKFYLAFVADDPAPDKIRAFYRDRDAAFSDDFVGVVVDTFNDERRGFEFFVNPLGVQMDATINDIQGGEDFAWDAIWDSAGQITETGYVVEMAIPLHQLRFPQGLDQQTWGIDLLRFYPRDVRHRLSNNAANYSLDCYLCRLQKAQGFSDLEQNLNMLVIPTLTTVRSDQRPNPVNDDWEEGKFDTEASVDLRWGINQDTFLSATLNPDFSQVEADDAQLDVNTTFTLFFPERREFFLDGADYFNSNVDLVHTRNIASPDYGLKLTGKQGNNTYGVFAANDESTSFLIPGTQRSSVVSMPGLESENAVLRYQRDIGRNTTLGVLTTARRADDYSNTVLSMDGRTRIGDSDTIEVQYMQSSSEYPGQVQRDYQQAAELDDRAYEVEYEHRGRNWRWELGYKDYGDDFRADMGFITQVGFTELKPVLGYTWRFDSDSLFNNAGVRIDHKIVEDQAGNSLKEETVLGLDARGFMQSFTRLLLFDRNAFYNGQYFDEKFFDLWTEMKPAGGMFLGLKITGGEQIDFANTQLGDRFSIGPEITFRLGRHFQFNLRHTYETMDVNGGQLYEVNLSDLRLTYQFGVRSFIRTIIQYQDLERDPSLYSFPVDETDKTLATQVMYSYMVNPHTRFYVGYSDAGYQDDLLRQIEKTNRTVFAKFSYAWQP